MTLLSSEAGASISAVSDLFGAMVQAGVALVAIVGGVVGARYVTVHARRQELAYDFSLAMAQVRGEDDLRGERLRRIAWRAGEMWVWDGARVRDIIARGRHNEYEIAAALDTDERYGAEREIDSILYTASQAKGVVEDNASSLQEVVREARRHSLSERAAVATYVEELQRRKGQGILEHALVVAVEGRLAEMVAARRDACERLDKDDRAEIETINARGSRASDVAQDRHAELLGLAQSGEYVVALKVLGATSFFSVAIPLGVMTARPHDSLALRAIGAAVFLFGLGVLARYMLIYARYLGSLDSRVELPAGFWKLMRQGAVPRSDDMAY